jgi:hypothetical protein
MESPNVEYQVISAKPQYETLQNALNRLALEGYKVVATTASDVIMERLAAAEKASLPPIDATAFAGANS